MADTPHGENKKEPKTGRGRSKNSSKSVPNENEQKENAKEQVVEQPGPSVAVQKSEKELGTLTCELNKFGDKLAVSFNKAADNIESMSSSLEKVNNNIMGLYDTGYDEEYDEEIDFGNEAEDFVEPEAEQEGEPPAKKMKATDASKVKNPLLSKAASKFKVNKPKNDVAVDEELAEIVGSLMSEAIPDDALKEQYEKYQKPENVPKLVTPRVNTIIWDKLPSEARTMDSKMQKVQNGIITGAVIVTQVVQQLMQLKYDRVPIDSVAEGLTDKLLDGLAMMGHANRETTMRRRELIKPTLNEDYKQLCWPSVQSTEWLFGDDISKTLKDIGEGQKLGKKFTSFGYRGRGRGQWRGRGTWRRGWGRGFSGNWRGNYGGGRGRGRGGWYGERPFSYSDQGGRGKKRDATN
jgi:hypothetical protein